MEPSSSASLTLPALFLVCLLYYTPLNIQSKFFPRTRSLFAPWSRLQNLTNCPPPLLHHSETSPSHHPLPLQRRSPLVSVFLPNLRARLLSSCSAAVFLYPPPQPIILALSARLPRSFVRNLGLSTHLSSPLMYLKRPPTTTGSCRHYLIRKFIPSSLPAPRLPRRPCPYPDAPTPDSTSL